MDQPGNIVIIDDNPNNLQVLSGILQTAGFKVRPALSGAIGLRAIRAQTPDLVLLDIRMPEMDGYETCRSLKDDEATHEIPVIFISALNAIEDKLEAFRAGGVDYLTKPFQAEEVIARARAHIELARTRRSLAESNARLESLMEQLVLAEKLKSLGALAAGMSHELNTPIGNALLGASTIEQSIALHRGPPSQALLSNCQSCAELIVRNLERASKLIGTMKESSIDRTSERRRRINLRNTIGEFVAIQGMLLKKTPYVIENRISEDIFIDTYPGPLEQILDNLVQNAIRHGFDQSPEGTIVIECVPEAEKRIALLVRDNGNGIAPEHLKHVFDPFFTTKLGQGGSGLGMHIVYNLANGILGGQVTISSALGQGTEVRLTLPESAPAPNGKPAAS